MSLGPLLYGQQEVGHFEDICNEKLSKDHIFVTERGCSVALKCC